MRTRRTLLLLSPALLATAAALASTAHAREAVRTAEYLCPSGERFIVEHYDGHVRLRTGSGVFALPALAGGENGYSDGAITLWYKNGLAGLERPGMLSSGACERLSATS